MAWLAVDKDGIEYVYNAMPFRDLSWWISTEPELVELPKGSIEKLIGRKLTWEDEAVEIK